jgi:hypothetical protein
MLDLRLKDMFNEGKMIVSGASLKIFGVTTHKQWLTMVLRNQAIEPPETCLVFADLVGKMF